MRLVDADALMQTYAKFVAPSNNSDFENEPTWNDAVSLLESAPTVDPVKHGHWIDRAKSILGLPTEACSECAEWSVGYKKDYCPHCGAKMDEVQNE